MIIEWRFGFNADVIGWHVSRSNEPEHIAIGHVMLSVIRSRVRHMWLLIPNLLILMSYQILIMTHIPHWSYIFGQYPKLPLIIFHLH